MSPFCTILENSRWTQTAYALLCQPQHKDTFLMCIYALIWSKIAHPCVQRIFSKMVQNGDTEKTNCWKKSLFSFLCIVNGTVTSLTVSSKISQIVFWRQQIVLGSVNLSKGNVLCIKLPMLHLHLTMCYHISIFISLWVYTLSWIIRAHKLLHHVWLDVVLELLL